MTKFIEVTEVNGDKNLINTEYIRYIYASSEGTTMKVFSKYLEIFILKESYEEIKAMLMGDK